MNIFKKLKIVAGIVACALFSSYNVCQAAEFGHVGTVGSITTINGELAGEPKDWFSLSTTFDSGSCPTVWGGHTVIKLDDTAKGHRQYSMLLHAKKEGWQVHVVVDDSIKDANGYCYVKYLYINH